MGLDGLQTKLRYKRMVPRFQMDLFGSRNSNTLILDYRDYAFRINESNHSKSSRQILGPWKQVVP